MRSIKHIISGIALILFSIGTMAQVFQDLCDSDTIYVDTSGYEINWQQFPDFELPFTIIYHGDAPSDSLTHPLKKGFSHIVGRGTYYRDTIWPEHRAYTWTGIANADNWAVNTNQPWRMIKSPWGNDIEGYREKWNHRLQNAVLTNYYKYHPPMGEARTDIIIADLEWAHHSDSDILTIKDNPLVPAYYQNLSDEDFIAEYKRDMSLLYAEPLRLARDSLHAEILLGSYAETPIRRTWYTIDDTSWQAWTTDSSLVDFLMEDTSGLMNSEFYNFHDVICPSIYNFYNVDSISIGRKYLAYNLFQIEANAAWSSKDQIVYCWLNYHPGSSQKEAIKPWMAEATAIFPLMSGISGLYPWKPATPYGYDVYEYFIYGLYRLSKYNDFFNGNGTYITPLSAHECFINELPVWRAVTLGNEILVAAHNPYSLPGDTSYLPLSYASWSDTIALVGNEVFLCKFEMSSVGLNDNTRDEGIRIYPNPTYGPLNISSEYKIEKLIITDQSGRTILLAEPSSKKARVDLSDKPAGLYLLHIETKEFILVSKVIKH